MNGPFQVAQASSAGNSANTPARVFKLTKPLGEQAVVVNLGYDQKVQVDFSAIANEKITLVHIGEKLIILFDNKSTVTVEPFFDSRHDALHNLTVEVAPGREVSVSEFASLFPITTDQSVLPAAGEAGNGNAQASGANFSNSSVDPLSAGNPLDLLGQEELGNFVIDLQPTGIAPAESPLPGPTIEAGVGLPLVVDESFIPLVGSQQAPAGSNTDSQDFSASFTITAPAGVQSVAYALTLAGGAASVATTLIDSVTGGAVTLFQISPTEVDAKNAGGDVVFTLVLDGTGHITLTELRGVHEGAGESPDASEGISLAAGLVSLTATVTDNNNATATASEDIGPNITIHDDGPTAHVDTNSAESGQTVTGNVETNDTAGADGIASIAWAGAVGNTVTLAHGVLTFDASGGYSYHANPNTSGTDVFDYTITDGDGDTSPSTLTITVTNGQPSVSPETATVNEAALDTVTSGSDLGHGTVTGSNPASTAETTTGTLTFSDPDAPVTVTGVAAGNVGSDVSGNVGSDVIGSYGILHVNANGTYTYTLTSPYDTSPDANNGTNTEPGRDVFTFTVTDGFGNTSHSTVSISIVDDVPTAHNDTDAIDASVFTASGNVITAVGTTSPVTGVDVKGADGATVTAITGTGGPLTGTYGTITIDAAGNYVYTTTAASVPNGASDVFTYTLTDGDGDTSTATLTINYPTVPAPTVAVGANNCVLEDTQEPIQFTATPQDANSHITQIVISGLTNWTVDTNTAHITASSGSVTGATFVAGVLTLTISGAAAGAAETVAVNMQAPANSDVDAHVTMTATAAEGPITVSSSGTAGIVYVDAVADMPTAQIIVTDSADAGVSFSNNEIGTLETKATFGDYIDGSETHTMTITLQPGFTATELTAGTHTGWTHNGVTYNLTYTYTPTNGTTAGTIVVTIPDNLSTLDSIPNNPNDNSGIVDLLFAIQAPATGTLPDPLNFSMTANATETPTDGGCGPGNTDIAVGNSADNTSSASATTGIPSTRLLSGTIITNSNSSAQDMVLTFVDQEHPLDAFSQLIVTNAQGQQGNVTSDSGFNIAASDHFLVSLDSPFETSKIIVTNFTLNGTTMHESSGNIQLGNNDGGAHDGFTVVMQTNNAAGVTGVDSADSNSANANVGDPSSNLGTYNMEYVDGNNATATGSNDSDLVSAAGTGNHEVGGAGNDILVYHSTDVQIDGGTGFDILRIDQGAIFNSHIEIPSASNNGFANATVNLTGNTAITNIESILLTEEPIASAALGTELDLGYSDVINFTGATNNSLTGTAHTLFILGSPGDDVQLAGGFTESSAANNYVSAGGQVFHQWTQTVAGVTATVYIDNDLQVNHAAQ